MTKPCRGRNGAALELGRSKMSKTVMIVEDNELNMKLFHDLLEAHGYHTIGTRNGIEALDLARNRNALGRPRVQNAAEPQAVISAAV